MKEMLRELDETRVARDDVITQSKDNEKRVQTLEAEVLQLSEVCAHVFVCVCVKAAPQRKSEHDRCVCV